MVIISKNEKETREIAAGLARKVVKFQKSAVIALEGELGAGKTVFVKGFAKDLGVKTKIKSPTFNLMKKYEIFSSDKTQSTKPKPQTNSKFKIQNSKFLIHLDCYRVRDHRDLATLDLGSVFRSHQNIVLIEWSERVSKILPKKLIRVHIDHIDQNTRKIKISND